MPPGTTGGGPMMTWACASTARIAASATASGQRVRAMMDSLSAAEMWQNRAAIVARCGPRKKGKTPGEPPLPRGSPGGGASLRRPDRDLLRLDRLLLRQVD